MAQELDSVFQKYPEDDGWNLSLTPLEAPRAFKLLREALVERQLICRMRGDVYIFSAASNQWEPLYSREAMVHIVDIIDAKSVSVNYEIAVQPFVSYLTKNAADADPYPNSICIGTWRLRPEISNDESGGGVTLYEVTGLLAMGSEYSARITGVCSRPLMFRRKPNMWRPDGLDIVRDHVSTLLPDPANLTYIQWVLGECLVEPVRRNSFVILYGPGGNGKSTLIRTLANTLRGASVSVPAQHLTSKTSGLHSDVVEAVVSKRLIYCADVDLKAHLLNLGFVRSTTGQDKMSTPLGEVSVCCSAIVGSNGLPSPTMQDDWHSEAIMRRVVVIPMFVDAMQIPAAELPDSEDAYLTFALRCVHTRLTIPHAPVGPEAVLITLLGRDWEVRRAKFLVGKLEAGRDRTEAQLEALVLLEACTGLPAATLVRLGKCISPSVLEDIDGITCFRGVYSAATAF